MVNSGKNRQQQKRRWWYFPTSRGEGVRARGILHNVYLKEAKNKWRSLYVVITPLDPENKEKIHTYGKGESALPLRQMSKKNIRKSLAKIFNEQMREILQHRSYSSYFLPTDSNLLDNLKLGTNSTSKQSPILRMFWKLTFCSAWTVQ